MGVGAAECPGTAFLTSLGLSPVRRNFRGVLLRAYLQPLKYMLQEQPKEKEAPQVLGSLPWQAQVRLQWITQARHIDVVSVATTPVEDWFPLAFGNKGSSFHPTTPPSFPIQVIL